MAIVMKFGGSSMGNAERIRAVAEIVKGRLDKKPLVVVSAMKGITDALIASMQQPGKFGEIEKTHADAIKELGLQKNLLEKEMKELQKAIEVISESKDINAKTTDFICSFGERLSARVCAAYLNKIGINAKAIDAWDLGLVTDSCFGCAAPLPESERKILENFKKIDGVGVITGFIAKDTKGEITTLGRGGSDYSAAIFGAAINSEVIEIWTDVNGIMSADPKVVPSAKTIDDISFDEAAELAFFGAKVLHPKTIIPAILKDIPVKVLNSFEPEHPGTTITKSTSEAYEIVKGISHKKNVTLVNIHTAKMLGTVGFAAKVFEIIARHSLPVDLIATSEINITLSVSSLPKENFEKALIELREFSIVSVEANKAIINVVGKGVRQRKGFSGRVFTILGNNSINIETISQAAPELSLSFVIGNEDAEKAVRALHEEFIK